MGDWGTYREERAFSHLRLVGTVSYGLSFSPLIEARARRAWKNEVSMIFIIRLR